MERMATMERKDTRPIEEGRMLGGRYRIVGELGRGGMSTVYAAEDTRLSGKLRAVKEVRRAFPELALSMEEARLLMRLSHPNLPQIVDYIPPDRHGLEYVVMDCVHGETAEQRLHRCDGRMPFEEIASVAIQLCGALAYLHEQSPPVIHRDLKPSNVMIDESGHVRRIDFGIARCYKEGKLEDTLLLGTPGFAAPEQIMGTQSDARTDIYGLGAVLYHLISGGAGFELFPSGPPTIRNEVPAAFFSAVARMMQTNANLRFQTIRQAEEALLAAMPGGQAVIRIGGNRGGGRMASLTAVLSVSQGAGATFVAMTTACLLAQAGAPTAAFELTGQPHEWSALLGGAAGGASRDTCEAAARSGFIRLKQRSVDWYCRLNSGLSNQWEGDTAVRRLIERALYAERTVLLDLSSGWDDRQGLEWLGRASTIVVVADPYPAKWSASRLQKLQAELAKAKEDGAAVLWIANKDAAFKHRRAWLSLLPETPAAIVPLLDYAESLDMLWDGHWPTGRPACRKQLERSLSRVVAAMKPLPRQT